MHFLYKKIMLYKARINTFRQGRIGRMLFDRGKRTSEENDLKDVLDQIEVNYGKEKDTGNIVILRLLI